MGLNRSTIIRTIGEIEDKGLLSAIRRAGYTTEYSFNTIPVSQEDPPPVSEEDAPRLPNVHVLKLGTRLGKRPNKEKKERKGTSRKKGFGDD